MTSVSNQTCVMPIEISYFIYKVFSHSSSKQWFVKILRFYSGVIQQKLINPLHVLFFFHIIAWILLHNILLFCLLCLLAETSWAGGLWSTCPGCPTSATTSSTTGYPSSTPATSQSADLRTNLGNNPKHSEFTVYRPTPPSAHNLYFSSINVFRYSNNPFLRGKLSAPTALVFSPALTIL